MSFAELNTILNDNDSRVRSFVVMRDGECVFEHFRHDAAPDMLEEVNSVTKSVVALAVGVALKEGRLPALDAPVAQFLAHARDPALDARVRRITIKHLLTMTSGFECDPFVIDECVLGACERFDADDAHNSRLRFILTRGLAHDPGRVFAYDSHSVHLLSHVIEHATGRTLARYVEEKLFAPLGIDHYEWIRDEAGHSFAARGLTLRTHDMAKLGVLMARRGTWRGAPLLNARFIDDALRAHTEGGPPMNPARYGQLWWIAPRFAFASGFGGQFIFVSRDGGLVAAATSDHDEASHTALHLFEHHVLGGAS